MTDALKDFVIAVLEDSLAYRRRFMAEVERLEAEGYTIAEGDPYSGYTIWRTGEVLAVASDNIEEFDSAVATAVAERGIEAYHVDSVLADDPHIGETLAIPGLPEGLVSSMQESIWELHAKDMPALAAYTGWPLEKVKAAYACTLDGPVEVTG